MTTTTHTNCLHPSTKAARTACRRLREKGYDALHPAFDQPKGDRPVEPARVKMVDSLGVHIEVGDRIIINAWGGNVRLTDVGSRGTVEGFTRTRVRVVWDDMRDLPAGVIRCDTIGVLRRDGREGFQGNIDR